MQDPLSTTRAESNSLLLDNDVFLVELGSRTLLYAPLRGILAEVPATVAMDLREAKHHGTPSGSAVAVLSHLGLLVSPAGRTPPLTAPYDDSFSPHGVVFMVTAACNLRCEYCYADAGDHPTHLFDRDMAHDAACLVIDNAATAGAKEAYLNYHGGGEPTLDMDFIIKVTETARAYASERYRGSVRVVTGMVSNGMLSQSKLAWIADNIDSIQISCDGPPSIHDLQRPTIRGAATAKIVARSIKYLTNRVPNLLVKATISRASVGRMGEIAEYLCTTFDLPRYHLGPVLSTGRGRSEVFGQPAPEDFVAGYYAAQSIADAYERTVVVSGALKTFPKLRRTFCGVNDPNFALTSDGNISACYEVMYEDDARTRDLFYGHYDRRMKTFEIDHQKIGAIRQRDVNSIAKCRNCFAKWHCAADCQARWLSSETGLPETGRDSRCEINRILIRDKLFAISDKGQQPDTAHGGSGLWPRSG